MQIRLIAVRLFCFLWLFVFASQSTAAANDPWPLIKNICFVQLHNPAKSFTMLSSMNWKRYPSEKYNEFTLLQNFITSGLKDEKSALFVSPSEKEIFLIGPDDNKLYPNNKCLYVTSTQEFDVPTLIAHVSREVSPLQPLTTIGKKYGNSRREWSLGTYERNISATRPINGVVLNHYPNKVPATNAFLNIAVVGMSRHLGTPEN